MLQEAPTYRHAEQFVALNMAATQSVATESTALSIL
jgi:hypothetical protein